MDIIVPLLCLIVGVACTLGCVFWHQHTLLRSEVKTLGERVGTLERGGVESTRLQAVETKVSALMLGRTK